MCFGKFMKGVGNIFNKIGRGIASGVGFVKDKVLPALSNIPILGQAVPLLLGNSVKNAGSSLSSLAEPIKNITGQGVLDVAGGVGNALRQITS
jgi:hypothetical protein